MLKTINGAYYKTWTWTHVDIRVSTSTHLAADMSAGPLSKFSPPHYVSIEQAHVVYIVDNGFESIVTVVHAIPDRD